MRLTGIAPFDLPIARLAVAVRSPVVLEQPDPYQPHLVYLTAWRVAPKSVLAPHQARGVVPPNPATAAPIGVRLDGSPVGMSLFTERGGWGLLISGSPGSGKRSLLTLLLDHYHGPVTMIGLDYKHGETLLPWSSAFGLLACSPTESETLAVLDQVLGIVERRAHAPHVPLGAWTPVLFVCEELAGAPDTSAVRTRFHRLAALARSSSIAHVWTIQRATACAALTTALRQQLALRAAFQCAGDRDASEAALGAGHHEAALLPPSPPGLAYIVQSDGAPGLVRTFMPTSPPTTVDRHRVPADDDLTQLEIWDLWTIEHVE